MTPTTYTMPLSAGGIVSSDAPISAVHVASPMGKPAAQTYSVIINGIEYRSASVLYITEGAIDADLKDIIRRALEGDSNDAEHEALSDVADVLEVEWTSFENKEDEERLEALQVEQEAADGGYTEA